MSAGGVFDDRRDREGESETGRASDRWAPRGCTVRAEDVEFLSTPTEFYERLCEGVATARRRIVLSSLYFGTRQPLERRLLSLLAAAAAKPDGPTDILVVLDCLRCTRPLTAMSSFASDLSEALVIPSGGRVRVALFHTPLLSSFTKRLVPRRFDEIVGVQHSKCFIFDDDVIVSGANLSESYFSTRQDRYASFRSSPALAERLIDFCETVAAHSYSLGAEGRPMPMRRGVPDPVRASAEFKASLRESLVACLLDDDAGPATRRSPWPPACPTKHNMQDSTVVYPLAQAGFADFHQETDAIDAFIRARGSESPMHCTMASAYLNLAPPWRRSLSCQSLRTMNIVTASSSSHGFQGATGIAGLVPYAYSLLELESLESLSLRASAGQCRGEVGLLEYARPGWEFHAKGLWLERKGEDASGSPARPFAGVIGSSNYGSRSAYRDLEMQLLLETSETGLRRRLGEELNRLTQNCVQAGRVRGGREDARAASLLGRLFVRAALPVLRRWM